MLWPTESPLQLTAARWELPPSLALWWCSRAPGTGLACVISLVTLFAAKKRQSNSSQARDNSSSRTPFLQPALHVLSQLCPPFLFQQLPTTIHHQSTLDTQNTSKWISQNSARTSRKSLLSPAANPHATAPAAPG